MQIERPGTRPRSLRQVVADFGSVYGASALAGFLFAASGPVAIILTIATRGGLEPSDVDVDCPCPTRVPIAPYVAE